MRVLSVSVILCLATAAGVRAADPAEEKAALATVQRLFDAMAARDAAAVRDVLLPDGRIASVRENGGAATLGGSTHAEFVERIGTAKEPLRERIWDPQVMVHGRIAMVWAPYDFHRGDQFSHCGVDLISLVKTAEGWKISGLTYTVETAGCASPR